jgi:hypothetical protein
MDVVLDTNESQVCGPYGAEFLNRVFARAGPLESPHWRGAPTQVGCGCRTPQSFELKSGRPNAWLF